MVEKLRIKIRNRRSNYSSTRSKLNDTTISKQNTQEWNEPQMSLIHIVSGYHGYPVLAKSEFIQRHDKAAT